MGWPVFGLPPWKNIGGVIAIISFRPGVSSLPYRGVLSFLTEAREVSGCEAARVHNVARRRRGGGATRGAGAAAGEDAAPARAGRLLRYQRNRYLTLTP